MRLTQQLIITSLILIISMAGTSEALVYSSYIFTTDLPISSCTSNKNSAFSALFSIKQSTFDKPAAAYI